jgi:hypothetical protein
MSQALFQSEERARQHRQLTDQAIQLALDSRWEEAVAVNRQILTTVQHDVSALNRLGKALSEVGNYGEAKKSYAEALAIDPGNIIARKNLERLSVLSDEAAAARPAGERIDPKLFIEETGKTGFTNLVDLAAPEVLARLAAGDQAYLFIEGRSLLVRNAADETVGRVEPRLANRLIKFLEGGNRYAAGITDLDGGVRIIIRETFQDPSQIGRVSFPPQVGVETVRPYIKDTMLRYDRDEEEEDTGDEEGEYAEGDESTEDLAETELEESDGGEMEE